MIIQNFEKRQQIAKREARRKFMCDRLLFYQKGIKLCVEL